MFNQYRLPWERQELKRGERPKGPLIAYDFETTPIPRKASDDPEIHPLYFTAYGATFRFSRSVDSYASLATILREHFLIAELRGARFVAWNGNRFDVRLVFEAIGEHLPEFTVQPYVANKGGLRGARVTLTENPKFSWEFLDGVAMTGLTGRSLQFFLERFAPEYQKFTGVIDFERERFDAGNAIHVAYAERDAEGLYHGLIRADEILRGLTKRGLQCTIGNAGIKYLTSHIPSGVQVWPIRGRLHDAMRSYGYRGGYVYATGGYDGPVYSYDINSAYPAAMREEDLPCGDVASTTEYHPNLVGAYYCYIRRTPRSPVPFYVIDVERDRPTETYGKGVETFLLSTEIRTLLRHGWEVKIHEGWVWSGSFRFTSMVDALEQLRQTCEGGPSGPIGLMAKAIGNNAYGKSAESLSSLKIVIAKEPPTGFMPYRSEDPLMRYYWFRHDEEATGEQGAKRYHRPHIAATITASVRCKIYDAIMVCPAKFLKADTDSVAFSAPIDHLPIDESRYGAFKVENVGNRHIILGKKVYAKEKPSGGWEFVCKGLSTKRLTLEMFERWYHTGVPPIQEQVQLVSWKSSLRLSYRIQRRKGTDFLANPATGPSG